MFSSELINLKFASWCLCSVPTSSYSYNLVWTQNQSLMIYRHETHLIGMYLSAVSTVDILYMYYIYSSMWASHFSVKYNTSFWFLKHHIHIGKALAFILAVYLYIHGTRTHNKFTYLIHTIIEKENSQQLSFEIWHVKFCWILGTHLDL